MTRVASVDVGTNSTRLLIAEVGDGRLTELERATQVTRLGAGVDAAGRLADDAIERTLAALEGYRELIEDAGVERTTGVLTSAVRDAANGPALLREVRELGIDARTISGDEEAALTFLGATSERSRDTAAPVLVIDIGGGSTELVAGTPPGEPDRHVSLQIGVVRQSERHIHSDPPDHGELERLAEDARALIAPAAESFGTAPADAIGVAGTPTSLAAIEQELDPYDPNRVHGYLLERGDCELMLARLAALPLAERRMVAGLHPDRAPTIVAGVVILLEVLIAFGLEQVEVSERDILHGAALRAVSAR